MFSEQKKRPFFKRKMGIVLLSVLAVIIIAALSGFLYVKSALGPVDQKSKQTINIHIPNGTSVREIAGILKKMGSFRMTRFLLIMQNTKRRPALKRDIFI